MRKDKLIYKNYDYSQAILHSLEKPDRVLMYAFDPAGDLYLVNSWNESYLKYIKRTKPKNRPLELFCKYYDTDWANYFLIYKGVIMVQRKKKEKKKIVAINSMRYL